MARPLKQRRVWWHPRCKCFEPVLDYFRQPPDIFLSLDELEAIRLADLEGFYQEEAAKKMNISRQTFGNILESARKKIADALINVKTLKIEGGVFKMMQRKFVCYDCRKEWSVPCGTQRPQNCPECKSTNIHRTPEERGWARKNIEGRGAGKRWCHGQIKS